MSAVENETQFPGGAQRRVVIAGAGIAGLAAGLRLREEGWDVLVVERAATRRSSGYLVNLHGPGYDAAERLGLLPALTPCDIGFFRSILVHADGREKFTIPAAFAQAAVGKRALTVFRGDLESALYDRVAETADIRFGTTVATVAQQDDGLDITLGDGTRLRAELLVGADGVHSGIRELVFAPESECLVSLGHMVGAFPLEQLPAHVPEGAGTTFIGPRRTAAVMNLGPGRSSTFFAYRCAEPEAALALGPERAPPGPSATSAEESPRPCGNSKPTRPPPISTRSARSCWTGGVAAGWFCSATRHGA
ncbi:FAD-dependent monooxygenase [Nocardia sp. NBC_00416]|uniref:FAD-dependent monooxygenase n=1 Tax=Nocardia sp. NBC_00416 TaxID=2975991 RepID=UPI002E1A998D